MIYGNGKLSILEFNEVNLTNGKRNLQGIKKPLEKGVVPKTGFEPAHPFERCDLNTVRLPISPLGQPLRYMRMQMYKKI